MKSPPIKKSRAIKIILDEEGKIVVKQEDLTAILKKEKQEKSNVSLMQKLEILRIKRLKEKVERKKQKEEKALRKERPVFIPTKISPLVKVFYNDQNLSVDLPIKKRSDWED